MEKTFNISSTDDLHKVQLYIRKHYKETSPIGYQRLLYVAQELIQNMLDEREFGSITIRTNKDLTVTIDLSRLTEQDRRDIWARINNAMESCHQMIRKGEETEYVSTKAHPERRGYGLLGILEMGWKLIPTIGNKSITLRAEYG